MDIGSDAAGLGSAGIRAHKKPRDIHSYGLKLLKKNGFIKGQSIDITYAKGEIRLFTMDAAKKQFYFDPSPVNIPFARLIFQIYSVDKITGASIYEREKVTEEKTKTGNNVVRLRSLGVQITMDDATLPVLHIQCLPFTAVGNSEYMSRLAVAQRIMTLLGDALGQKSEV